MAVSSSISARKYSSSSRRKTSRSLCGSWTGACLDWGGIWFDWAADGTGWQNALRGDRIAKLTSMAAAATHWPARHWILLFDFNSAPKGYMVFDVAGCRLGVRVVPCGILIFLSVHQKAVVSRLPLPGTGRDRRAGAEVFPLK